MVQVALILLSLLSVSCGDSPTQPSAQPLVILSATGAPTSGFNIQLNTDRGRTDWLTPMSDSIRGAYPSGQQWGFVGVVLDGNATAGSRPSRDLSSFKMLQVQLRGELGGERVEVGIKDNTDPDDGTEVKKTVVLTSSWQTLTYTLSDFSSADLRRTYLPLEVVFAGESGAVVYVRDLQFLP